MSVSVTSNLSSHSSGVILLLVPHPVSHVSTLPIWPSSLNILFPSGDTWRPVEPLLILFLSSITFVVTMLFSLVVIVSLWYDCLLHLQGIQDIRLEFMKNPLFFIAFCRTSRLYYLDFLTFLKCKRSALQHSRKQKQHRLYLGGAMTSSIFSNSFIILIVSS